MGGWRQIVAFCVFLFGKVRSADPGGVLDTPHKHPPCPPCPPSPCPSPVTPLCPPKPTPPVYPPKAAARAKKLPNQGHLPQNNNKKKMLWGLRGKGLLGRRPELEAPVSQCVCACSRVSQARSPCVPQPDPKPKPLNLLTPTPLSP